MFKKNIYKKKESGEIILFVMFVVLFLVMFVSLFLSKLLTRQAKTSSSTLNSVQAYYIADTGAENTLYVLSQTTTLPPEGESVGIATNLFPGHSCSAVVAISNPTTLKINIIGTYKYTSRAIELFW